jgi:hypothetical protein
MPSGIVAAALDPDGLQRCLAERRIYAEDSSEPEPAMAAPEPPPIAGAEESDGDFFAELARLVTPGAEAEATTPSEDAAPRAARDETVEAREEEAKVEDIQEEAGVSDVGEVEERPRTRPGIEGRRVAPLARLGGAVARVGDPETRGKTEVDEPPGFTTGGLEVLLGVEVLISPRLGLQAGLGGLGTWGPGLVGDEQPDPSTMAEVTLKPSSLLAADARIQAAVHLGPVGLSLGPTFRLLAMNAAVWESDEFGGGSFSAWQGSALGIGLAADATVALGRHPFLYASGWATRDNRLWLDATLGFGWKL